MSNSATLPNDTPENPPAEAFYPLDGLSHNANGMELKICSGTGTLILRGNQEIAGFQQWYSTYFDSACPTVGTVTRRDGLSVYWQSHDQLLLSCDNHDIAQSWHSKLDNQRPEQPLISLIDVSDYYVCICLEGGRAFDILRQGCPYNFKLLHQGDAIFTHYIHAGIVIDYAGKNLVKVLVRNSYAKYLWDHFVYASEQIDKF